jgi:hypothetical protein
MENKIELKEGWTYYSNNPSSRIYKFKIITSPKSVVYQPLNTLTKVNKKERKELANRYLSKGLECPCCNMRSSISSTINAIDSKYGVCEFCHYYLIGKSSDICLKKMVSLEDMNVLLKIPGIQLNWFYNLNIFIDLWNFY